MSVHDIDATAIDDVRNFLLLPFFFVFDVEMHRIPPKQNRLPSVLPPEKRFLIKQHGSLFPTLVTLHLHDRFGARPSNSKNSEEEGRPGSCLLSTFCSTEELSCGAP
jgi:hypothetical protein